MPDIKQLDHHVAELIAAGEVVERPASVMKELLENALDADASAVVAEIEHGGLTYLRITDDGCGISPEQLPTAFLRHATSKVRTADDLAAIGTLGFRGEALAAISAVSHVDIFSRVRGCAEGARLHLDGGTAESVTPAGCPEGTTICVRELFYNTPARMKFMKKDSAESAAVSGIVTHLALSRPDVSFKLLRDGQEALHTPGDGKLYSAIYAALGREFALSLLPVDGCGGDIKVQGFVTKPLLGGGTRSKQIFFVNGRLVKSQLLTVALEEAYKNRLMKGKFPGCVLHITMPPQDLDANVHPAKTVVKFAGEKAVFHAVYYTVMDALDAENDEKSVDKVVDKVDKPHFSSMNIQEYRKLSAQQVPAQKVPLGSFTVRRPAEQDTLVLHDAAPEKGKAFAVPSPTPSVHYIITPPDEKSLSAPKGLTSPPAAPLPEKSISIKEDARQESFVQDCPAPWRIAGEILKTYIVCEDGEDIFLIDKHAAHERLRFDALKEKQAPLMRQALLTPLTVTLSAEQYDAALRAPDMLQTFGFFCEDFGDGTLLVREIPSDIMPEDAPGTLEELCEKMSLGAADSASVQDALLQTMACKSAIRAGMNSDESELRVLVNKVQSGEIRYCPHGRPIMVKLSQRELEKMFKRT